MSAWKLQKEFLHAVRKFYDFTSSFKIMKIFGINSGLRRLGLWLISRFGIIIAYCYLAISQHSYYKKLKHFSANKNLQQ
jgi:hypothetical protein